MPRREFVHTSAAPAAIGPYSQGVVVAAGGRTLFTSGQIALDPKTGVMVEGDIRAQTERVLDNLHAILVAAGMGFDDVVRAGIFLADLADFAVVNELYGARFGERRPARTTVQAAGLPKGARVEIDVVAVGD